MSNKLSILKTLSILIWFTEKGEKKGATGLYPLNNFYVRKIEPLKRNRRILAYNLKKYK